MSYPRISLTPTPRDISRAVNHLLGGVEAIEAVVGPQQAAIANVPLAAAAPTMAEFNALVTAFNTLLAELRTHGLIAP